MTAEIAVMNKSGIALAADSAVTVSFPDGRDGRFRSSKIFSTNKLFMLSKYYPIGIMIFGNASLMGVPWEIIIKEYRKKELAVNNFPLLENYGSDFIEYLNGNTFYFSDELQQEKTSIIFARQIDEIMKETKKRLLEMVSNDEVSDEKSFEEANQLLFDENVNKKIAELQELDYIETFQVTERVFNQKYGNSINEAINKLLNPESLSVATRTKLKRIAYLSIVKNTFAVNNSISGIVIAGFGEKEIYPSLVSYDIECVVNDKLKFLIVSNWTVGNQSDVFISPFAQGEMVRTFVDGVSPNYQKIVDTYLQKLLDSYPGSVADKLSGLIKEKQKTSLENQLKEIGKELFLDFKNQIGEWVRIHNRDQILDAVEALPIEELASMAEALVNLTSFKRRVTPVLETVGGPVDVAVITKGDGFVWIQRKHYFEANKNPHFFKNYYKGENYEEAKNGKRERKRK
jgi:hypothetical protein